jgi:hypothetical protein
VRIGGAAYVLIGAHKRGGRLTEKRFSDAGRALPIRHVRFDDEPAVEAFVRELRDRDELLPGAAACFDALLAVMREIEASALWAA